MLNKNESYLSSWIGTKLKLCNYFSFFSGKEALQHSGINYQFAIRKLVKSVW